MRTFSKLVVLLFSFIEFYAVAVGTFVALLFQISCSML